MCYHQVDIDSSSTSWESQQGTMTRCNVLLQIKHNIGILKAKSGYCIRHARNSIFLEIKCNVLVELKHDIGILRVGTKVTNVLDR